MKPIKFAWRCEACRKRNENVFRGQFDMTQGSHWTLSMACSGCGKEYDLLVWMEVRALRKRELGANTVDTSR